ncbi:hypothetical protein WDW37_17645 [Bdellovibrionota bacterium FG-1]
MTNKEKADFSLRPKMNRIGGAMILSISKVKDGKIVFSSQLKTVQMDEIDKVSRRVGRGGAGGSGAC